MGTPGKNAWAKASPVARLNGPEEREGNAMTTGDMSAEEEISASLAQFVATSCWETIPAAARHEAKRALLNFFAVSMAGCSDPTIMIAAHVFRPFAANREASVIGSSERSDILNASALNAMSANVFDFDDTHLPTIIHPTAPVAPAVFALAERETMSGRDLLTAFILGVEVACRLGNAISPEHYARGWHITSTCGIFGSAMAAGKAIGLDASRLRWALGHASSQSSGLVETLGTMSKSAGVGAGARNGLLSALLAQHGFTGPDHPLEGEQGFLRVMGDKPDMASISTGLGNRWEILRNTYKPYPCGVVLNPVIEGCLDLFCKADIAADELAAMSEIEITGHPLLRQRADRPEARTGREAQVSAQHAVAVSLLYGKAGLAQFSDDSVADPTVLALGKKVRFIDDDRIPLAAAKLRLLWPGARAITTEVHAARGSVDKPMTDKELEDKLREVCRNSSADYDPDPLIGAVWSLDENRDAGALMALTRPRENNHNIR